MLCHACGYALANAGHDTRALQAWLGHKNIQHTVRYTEYKGTTMTLRRVLINKSRLFGWPCTLLAKVKQQR
jgi:site-specific recombinase XerD